SIRCAYGERHGGVLRQSARINRLHDGRAVHLVDSHTEALAVGISGGTVVGYSNGKVVSSAALGFAWSPAEQTGGPIQGRSSRCSRVHGVGQRLGWNVAKIGRAHV